MFSQGSISINLYSHVTFMLASDMQQNITSDSICIFPLHFQFSYDHFYIPYILSENNKMNRVTLLF